MESAAGLAYQPCSLPTGVDPVQWTFSTAAQNGFTVARVFAHGVNATLALQTSPGKASSYEHGKASSVCRYCLAFHVGRKVDYCSQLPDSMTPCPNMHNISRYD